MLTFRLSIPEVEIRETLEVTRTHDQIRQRILAIPGVESVGMSSSVTMDGQDNNDLVFLEDFPTPEGQVPPLRRIKYVSPDYFATMQNPLLSGDAFSWNATWAKRREVIITENLAREYWGNPRAALGKRVRRGPQDSWFEITGVVGNIYDDGVGREPVPTTFWPLLLERSEGNGVSTPRSLAYAVRGKRVGSTGFESEIRSAVWSINSNLPLANLQTLAELVSASLARTSFTLIMLSIAGGVALLLGTVGIYGVVSYAVAQRTREIGVRMALGASNRDVSGLILRRGLVLTSLGIVLGSGIALAVTRFMAVLLFGVDPVDPITFGVVALLLASIALVASYLPARRASHIDPIDALRRD